MLILSLTVVSKEIIINRPLKSVWDAWVTEEMVSKWFAPKAVVQPWKDGSFELYFIPGNTENMNTRGCKITSLTEEEIIFTWKGPDPFASIMNHSPLTTVHVKFLPQDVNTTKIILEHKGFIDNEEWAHALKWHEMAWTDVLGSLKSFLEANEGNVCCQ